MWIGRLVSHACVLGALVAISAKGSVAAPAAAQQEKDVPGMDFLGDTEPDYEELEMDYIDPEDMSQRDQKFANFFDTVIIPASKQRAELDPRISVTKGNASLVRECSASNKRILEADHRVIIVGGGPAGLSAAVYAARANMQPLVVSKDGGQLESTSWVDNYPGFAEGVDAIELIVSLTKQAERFGAAFKECTISRVDIDCRPFRVVCEEGEVMTSSALIVASGASAKWLGVPGERELLSRGVHTCATCDGFFYRERHAAVIGGGDTAMEQALFLARFAKRVTVIHRRDTFRASKAMVTRVLNHPLIDIMWNTRVIEFIEEDDKLFGLHLETRDMSGETNSLIGGTPDDAPWPWEAKVFPVEGVFVAIGHTPSTQLFRTVRKDAEGYIYTIPGSTVTSVTGVYAAGDVQDPVYRQAITSAGTGAMAAMDAERWLCEHGC